jgi:hypothetical protein
VELSIRLEEGDANVGKGDETKVDEAKSKEEVSEAIDDEPGSRDDVLGEGKTGVELTAGVGPSGTEEDNAEFGQFPNNGLHPEPQWTEVFPQNPYSLQHSPSTYPIHVYRSSPPQAPSGEMITGGVGVGLGGGGAQLPNRGLHPEPQWVVVFPQNPYSLQHSPSTYPIHV